MARREYDYIKGSTALAPERKQRVRKPDKKYKHIQRRKNIQNKNNLLRNKRKNDRKYILTVAAVIFTLGVVTITGDIKVYNMEKKALDISSQIKQTKEENEALKVKILTFSSLRNIEQKANTSLAMYIPKKEETVKIDFSQNYFKDIEAKAPEKSNKETGFLAKLMNLIK